MKGGWKRAAQEYFDIESVMKTWLRLELPQKMCWVWGKREKQSF